MKLLFLLTILLTCVAVATDSHVHAQTRPATQPGPSATPTPPRVPQRQAIAFDLEEFGVNFQTEPRLIIMMAALEAAGLDLTANGEPSPFRAQVRKDLAALDPDLRGRLRTFFERNKLPAPATAADQAARYVSLAFALSPPPTLEAPVRSEDLPGSLLAVLDFAPLVQEFYRRSNIQENIPSYTRAYQAEGDRLRQPTAEMVRSVLSYLHTRPITTAVERVKVKPPTTSKKNAQQTYSTRERLRRFSIVPDLLAAPGVINFRAIGDEYYVVVPEGTDPTSSELRRGYLQYIVDALVLRFNREVAARRPQIKQIIETREKAGATISPDVFLAVSRSFVAAADARYDHTRKLENLNVEARAKLATAKDQSSRLVITTQLEADKKALTDETIARLADDYERGAILDFFFAEQLQGLENSGFDVASFLVDMITSFDPAKESQRLAENSEARTRALAARQARLSARKAEAPVSSTVETPKTAFLVKRLGEIEQTLRLKDYTNAETQLKELLKDYSGEPRIFFALAQTASLAAADAIDEEVQGDRLRRALGNYRLALQASSPETDRALISRAHEAMGRIYAFLDESAEAAKEFDEAIRIGDVAGGAYKDAIEGRRKLAPPR